jgi:hypothetical protein
VRARPRLPAGRQVPARHRPVSSSSARQLSAPGRAGGPPLPFACCISLLAPQSSPELPQTDAQPPTAASAAFRQLLPAGSPEAALPLLRWLLPQAPLLTKRAFVGYHLMLPEVSRVVNLVPTRLNRPLASRSTANASHARTRSSKVKHGQAGAVCPPPCQMPEELSFDPLVADLKSSIRDVQAEFVGAHKAAEAAREFAE